MHFVIGSSRGTIAGGNITGVVDALAYLASKPTSPWRQPGDDRRLCFNSE
jgi:hypothetical protein